MSASRSTMRSRPHMTSLMYSLPVRRLKEILSRDIPTATLETVQELPSTQLTRLYNLNMSDDRRLLLSFAPSLTVRLLRQEATLLSSEATLVYFIAGSDRKPEMEGSQHSEIENSDTTMLKEMVPKLHKHSTNNNEMAYPYSIFEYPPGQTLSALSVYLSLPERHIISKAVGDMARALATLTSPSGQFGTVSRVLAEAPTVAGAGSQHSATPRAKGSETWSEAFNTLLEGILRDGEDIFVLLPYETIRSHFERERWRLDEIKMPRLVILDIGAESNVMVERSSSPSTDVKLTGLRSWAQGVFGDPLIADAFENPSEGFLEGWNGNQQTSGGEELVEDKRNAEIRMLLYRCYRAVVSIVTEHYRPDVDSSRKELEGRRKLTTVLKELEAMDVTVNEALKRVRRLSEGDEESSKRAKIEGDRA